MSTDAADLFCLIFDGFETSHLDPYEVDEWMTDRQVMDISSLTEGQVIDTGTLDEDEVWSGIEIADDADKRRFAYLQGIDNALLHAHPHTGSHDTAGLNAIATRYVTTGKFSTDAVEGALLPRFVFPAEDDEIAVERLADAMTSVVRVAAAPWSQTEHVSIPNRSDFHRLRREQGIVVGCVPFLESLDELEWSTSQLGASDLFQAKIIPSPAIEERVTSVLNLLDQQGAMVGVIPEVCLSDEVLGWWRQAIGENPPPRDSRLRWIFVGTGPTDPDQEPPTNTGFLLDRLSGAVLMQQDKIFPFQLTPDQIERWGLEDYVGSETTREDITRGERVTVAETALGRLSVLICEDLARTMDLGPPLRDHGLSHAICPVFSDMTMQYHWEHNKAKEYAEQVGTQMIVANSRAVGTNRGGGTFGTALAHSPFGTELGESSHCEEVVLIHIADEIAVRLLGPLGD